MTDSFAEQRDLILAPFADYLRNSEEDVDGVIGYMKHCGIDLREIDTSKRAGVEAAILNHYRIGTRRFDIDRAANDVLRLPAVQALIAELQHKRQSSKAE